MRRFTLCLLVSLVGFACASGGWAMDVAGSMGVFQRCLSTPIKADVEVSKGARLGGLYVDEEYGIRWRLPKSFRVIACHTEGVVVVATSKSETFGVVVEKPYPLGGRSLDQVVKDYGAEALRSGRSRILRRQSLRFGGLPAIRLYLQTRLGDKTTCASEVFVERGGYVYQVAVLQRLYEGYCMSDVLVGTVTADWKWIKARALGLEAGKR